MPKPKPAPKLTDAQRHARFKEMAKEVEADSDAKGFDDTMKRLAALPKELGPKGS